MSTEDQHTIRLDMIERKMEKYDSIIDELREVVIELKTKAETNFKWTTGLLGISCAIIGGLIGHIVH